MNALAASPVLAAGIMDLNPGLTLWTAITFLLLIGVLGKYAFGPIVKMLDERERTIRDAIDEAKRERAEAEKLLAQQKDALLKAQREAAEIAKRNAQEMEVYRAQLTSLAKKESDTLVANARKQIGEEKNQGRRRAARRGGRPGRRGRGKDREVEPGREDAATARRGLHQGPPGRTGLAAPGLQSSRSSDGRPSAGASPFPGANRKTWVSPSESSACRTWASRPSSTRCSARRRPRRQTTRSAPSSRTWGWCPCRTSGWPGWPRSTTRGRPPRPRSSSWTSPAWWPGRRRGRGSETSSSPTSGRRTRSPTCCAASRTPTSSTWAAGWDPRGDRDVVETELMLKDLEQIERRREKKQKDAKAPGKPGELAKAEMVVLDEARAGLERGVPVRDAEAPGRVAGRALRPLPPHREARALHRQRATRPSWAGPTTRRWRR